MATKTAAPKAARKTAAKPAPAAAAQEWTPAPAAPEWTAAPEPSPAQPAAAGFNERQYAMFLHLSALAYLIGLPGFLGPLIMWLVKKDESAFVDRHGRAAMNFHLSVLLYIVAAVVLIGVVAVVTLGIGVILMIPLIVLGAIAAFVLLIILPILAGLRANEGQEHRYPLSITFLKPRQ